MENFFDPTYLAGLNYDNLPALVSKGKSRETVLEAYVKGWCTPGTVNQSADEFPPGDPMVPIRDAVNLHIRADEKVLEGFALWDENSGGAPIDLCELLQMVEDRLSKEDSSTPVQPRPDLFILLRGCRVYKCEPSSHNDGHGPPIRPRFVTYGVHFDDKANFGGLQFSETALFEKAVFGQSANFVNSNFKKYASFYESKIGESANFQSAQFNGSACFDQAIFGDSADFSNVKFDKSADFRNSKFRDSARFINAEFHDTVNFNSTEFGKSASFRLAKFHRPACFKSATFGEYASFNEASFGDLVSLVNVTLGRRADFREARFEKAADFDRVRLAEADSRDCDLRNAHGFILDRTLVRGTGFSPKSSDPWSVLRRAYTGPRMIFTLLFLIAFFLPYVARTAYWVGVNRIEIKAAEILRDMREHAADRYAEQPATAALESVVETIARRLPGPENPDSRKTSVVNAVLGVDRGFLFWSSVVVLILYKGALKIPGSRALFD